jgi:hypothetical protein
MPDGDLVHEGLARVYQKPYMQICDGQFGDEKIAKELGDAIWKDIRNSSDTLLSFFQEVAARCKWIQENLMFETIDWQQESDQIGEQKRHVYMDVRLRNLAESACKDQINELQHGMSPSQAFYTDILTKYMWNVCRANFQERIPLTETHHNGASTEDIYERLETMRPFLHLRISQYAEEIQRYGTFHIPKQPAWSVGNSEAITMDTDVFSIGR